MAQGNDNLTGELLPGFKLPANGNTETIISATGAIVNATPAIESGFYEFVSTADCYIALGTGAATVPVAGMPGGLPLKAGVAKAYWLPKNGIVSAISTNAFQLFLTAV